MPKTVVLCLDDSGTRNPTRKIGRTPAHGYDWFALGGIIFDEDNEVKIRSLHREFINRWNIESPLHSSEIRAKANKFSFIGRLNSDDQKRFYEELYILLKEMPALGTACVIDRPCYNERYLGKYDDKNRWMLCKSAFAIVTERAVKFARMRGAKLRIYIERGDRTSDRLIEQYYKELRANGMPFSRQNSDKYSPVTEGALAETLYDFRRKSKSSPLMQLADLFLWPICMGGYNAECRPFKRLSKDKKLIDALLDDEQRSQIGIKYYCFDMKKPG